MARQGWFPTAQAYQPGLWRCGYFLIALPCCASCSSGILIFIYMLIVKPDGVLVVTYEYRGGEGLPTEPPPPDAIVRTRRRRTRAEDDLRDDEAVRGCEVRVDAAR